ncbi:MAG TPA: proton-conducting transporter membrane subunit [bacterium]|nr:proton-conducting transporter membrane subunit [bacterium]
MILPYFIIIPLLAAFLITLIAGEKDHWGIAFSLITGIVLTVLAFYSFLVFRSETLVYQMGGWKLPYGIVLVQDALTGYMLVIVNLIALTSLLFSVNYIRYLDPDWKYYALFMLLLAGMNGVILTGDLFNLFVFMEIALLAAFALVAYGGRAEEYEAAFKYAVMGAVSSTIILVGITVTYSSTSALTMAAVADALSQGDPKIVHWIGGLFLVGFGLKAAAMPFHAWLPDAHSSAPAPISSMLSGVLIKVLGIYVIMRLFFNVLGAPDVFIRIFLVLSAISILVAGFISVNQWDMKRLLAYSSISQIGYILLGLGIATPLGILGAVFHLLNHAIFKSLLFFNAGTVEMMLGTRDLKKMGNLTRALPLTSNTSLIASLAISGIPPFNGFFSKLIIIIAAIQAGYPLYAIFAIVGSVLTMAALMKVQRYGFRGENEVDIGDKKVNWKMNTAMATLAVLCLVASVLIIPGIKEAAFDPVISVITEKTQYIQAVMGR